MPEIECCGSLNHHIGKEQLARRFQKNINLWYDEYLKNGLDAIISNIWMWNNFKRLWFVFREDKDLKRKQKYLI